MQIGKKSYLAGIIIIFVIALLAIWSGAGSFYSNGVPITLTNAEKVLSTIVISVIFIAMMALFIHQNNRDQNPNYTPNTEDKIVQGAYKFQGGYYKMRAVGALIGAIVASGAALYFLYQASTTTQGSAFLIFSGLMLIVAIGAAIKSWIYWGAAKTRSSGRLYS